MGTRNAWYRPLGKKPVRHGEPAGTGGLSPVFFRPSASAFAICLSAPIQWNILYAEVQTVGKSRQGRTGGGGERVRSGRIARAATGGAAAGIRKRTQKSGSRRTKRNGSASRRASDREQMQQAQEMFQPQDPFWDPWDEPPFGEGGYPQEAMGEESSGRDHREAGVRQQGQDPFDEW